MQIPRTLVLLQRSTPGENANITKNAEYKFQYYLSKRVFGLRTAVTMDNFNSITELGDLPQNGDKYQIQGLCDIKTDTTDKKKRLVRGFVAGSQPHASLNKGMAYSGLLYDIKNNNAVFAPIIFWQAGTSSNRSGTYINIPNNTEITAWVSGNHYAPTDKFSYSVTGPFALGNASTQLEDQFTSIVPRQAYKNETFEEVVARLQSTARRTSIYWCTLAEVHGEWLDSNAEIDLVQDFCSKCGKSLDYCGCINEEPLLGITPKVNITIPVATGKHTMIVKLKHTASAALMQEAVDYESLFSESPQEAATNLQTAKTLVQKLAGPAHLLIALQLNTEGDELNCTVFEAYPLPSE